MVTSANVLAASALAALFCITSPAMALDPRYPDWPCQQLKVPDIALAAVWTGPPIDAADKQQLADPKDVDLVSRLAARRTPMEEARQLVNEFVAGSKAEKRAKATALFAALFSVLDGQRSEVMNGIERFSRKEKTMADDIRANTRKIQKLEDTSNGDRAEIDQLANQVAWQTRIFEDRRKSTSYVCEVPVLIEKRLFALGRVIEDAANAEP
jgi:hypothetical protein